MNNFTLENICATDKHNTLNIENIESVTIKNVELNGKNK